MTSAPKKNAPWMNTERRQCHDLYQQGLTTAMIARRLGRTVEGVRARIKNDGRSKHSRRPWADDDVRKLRRMWLSGMTGAQIAATLDRTRSSVMGKLNTLGLLGVRNQDIAA